MPDLEISRLPELASGSVQGTDPLAIADLSASETKKITVQNLIAAGVTVLPAGSIPSNRLAYPLPPAVVDTQALQDRAVTGAKVALDTLTADHIAPNAITASELADASVDTAAIQPGAVTGGAGGSLANYTIDSNNYVAGSVDTSALKDRSVTSSKLALGAITGGPGGNIDLSTITTDNIAEINGSKLTADSVTAREIAANAVTSSELSDNSVDTVALQVNAVSGSAGPKPTILAASIGPLDLAANSVTANALADNAVDTAALVDGAVTNNKLAGGIALGKLADTTGPNEVLAGPTSGGGTVSARKLVGSDLPIAGGAARGAVSVSGQGLRVVGDQLEVNNDVTASGTAQLVTFDAKGLVTGGKGIAPSDMPIATTTVIGAVTVPSDGGINVEGSGAIRHANTITAGTASKVSFDAHGHVTGALALTPADVPALDASKLNTGTLDPARIGDRSVTQEKLTDYAISFIQEAEPASKNLYHNGMLWYQESTAQLHMWNGNSWMSVGSLGRLGNENMRFCGTFTAATGDIIDLTPFGTTSGFAVGPIPAATDPMTGAYFVCKTAGTYNSVLYDAGDWVLCLGATKGWVRIDTLNGGSSSVALKDLLDVRLTTPANGETLIFDGTLNKWVNRPTTGTKATFTQAPDGTRSNFTLSADGSSATGLLISVGGIIQEPNKDYTFTAPRTVNFLAPLPAGVDYWVLIEGVPGTGGGGGGGATLPTGTADEPYLQWNSTLSAWVASTVLTGGTF